MAGYTAASVCRRAVGLDSIISISCRFVVQQVVRLAVRLADFCTTCCGFVVQLVVQHIYSKSKLMESEPYKVHNVGCKTAVL